MPIGRSSWWMGCWVVGSVFGEGSPWWNRRARVLDEARARKHYSEAGGRAKRAAWSARVERPRASGVSLVPCPIADRNTSILEALGNSGRGTRCALRSLLPVARSSAWVVRLPGVPSPFGSPPGTSVGRPPSATRLPSRLGRSASPHSLVPRTSLGRARERAQRAPVGPTGRSIPPDAPHGTPPRIPSRPETRVPC